MGPGFAAMNCLTVLQTSQGVASYLLRGYGQNEVSGRGVLIGFDGRHHSRRFAHAAAAAFLAKGFKVYLIDSATPTPLCPYGVVQYKTLAGIQITASHNPKQDNGYKLYGDNGAQICPPVDADISAAILANLDPWPEALECINADTGYLRPSPQTHCQNPLPDLWQSYLTSVPSSFLVNYTSLANCPVDVIYTAMHGVGFQLVRAMLVDTLKLPESRFHAVPEQRDPDPEFSTVAFPNPEERGALSAAMALADSKNARIVIANDPDADRFAAAEKQRNGQWYVFKGDELGILLAFEMLEVYRARGVSPKQMVFLNSTVSSRMLEKLAVTEGAKYSDTMTGFKWMMNAALAEQKAGNVVPFVYEEALGYAVTTDVPDKDGISAAAVWMLMVQRLAMEEGKHATDQLDGLRKKYGYYMSNNGYFFCYDPSVLPILFAEIQKNYPQQVQSVSSTGSPAASPTKSGRIWKIARLRDSNKGYDSAAADKKSKFPRTPTSHMLTLFFENGAVVTLRTSGTEPKLKWYSELGGTNPEATQAELDELVEACIRDVIHPDNYSLIRPAK